MKQAADGMRLSKFVVPAGSLLRLEEVHLHPAVLENLECLGADAKALPHASREHEHCGPVVEQLADVRRLTTLPGVGPVTATTFKATVDEVGRFHGARQVAAYLGLVPRERSSGERQQRGRITKAGNSRARSLLIEASWLILRAKRADTMVLRAWAERIAARRGRRIAAVALARRLARILYAMWRDATGYDPERIRRPRPLAG